MLEAGMNCTVTTTVDENNTALHMASGGLEVFATPAMAALMERAAMQCVAAELEDGCGTVGTKLDISHISATPCGMTVTCTATLREVDGRRLVFDVEAFDDAGRIGAGTHERFIIKNESFLKKTYSKLS